MADASSSVVDGIINRLLEVRGHPGKLVSVSETEVRQLCVLSKEIFLKQPCLLELKAPIKIAGDIHGQYCDLLRLFEVGGFPPKAKYLFLGNYVYFGKQSLETICLLLAYKIKYPDKFYMLRGNRECGSIINRTDGFYDECKRRFNNVTLRKTIIDCFNCLPIAAIIDNRIFCVHGGLSPYLSNLDSGLLCDLIWSDPSRDVQGWGKNDRGFSCTFGAEKVKEFVKKYNLHLICRGHQVVKGGFEFFADKKLVTIFSAPNYCGEYDNFGAIMDANESLQCAFPILKPAEKKPQFSSTSKTQSGSSSGVKPPHNTTTTTTNKSEVVKDVEKSKLKSGCGIGRNESNSNKEPGHQDSEREFDKPMDQAVLDAIICRLLNHQAGKQIQLSESEVHQLCIASKNIFLQQSCLLKLEGPVMVVGDIHGQYSDLLRIFENHGFPPHANYLFLGNYVGSGRQSLETICLLLAYKIKYPGNFFLLRGNHECAWTNHIDGFYDECKKRFNIRMWKTINDCFNSLPIAALIGKKIFCIHGGLSPKLELDQINKISRPTDVPKSGLLCDLLWSDPDNVQDCGSNDRGFSYTFGVDKVMEFIEKHHLQIICRGHQVVKDGYEFFSKKRLVTIFSVPNYRRVCDNAAAIMSVDTALICYFHILKPAEKSSSGVSLLDDTTSKKVEIITPILKYK